MEQERRDPRERERLETKKSRGGDIVSREGGDRPERCRKLENRVCWRTGQNGTGGVRKPEGARRSHSILRTGLALELKIREEHGTVSQSTTCQPKDGRRPSRFALPPTDPVHRVARPFAWCCRDSPNGSYSGFPHTLGHSGSLVVRQNWISLRTRVVQAKTKVSSGPQRSRSPPKRPQPEVRDEALTDHSTRTP